MQPALQLALLLAILLPACKIAASLFSRLGIPPILGELLVGVVLGPGALNLLHLRLFDGGQATGALMLATVVAELVAPRVLARLGYRATIAAGLVLLGVPALALAVSGSVGAVVALFSWSRHRASPGSFLANSILPGRSSHRYERLDFCADTHGRWENVLS